MPIATLVANLLAWICATTGYPVPATQPTVEFVRPQVIRERMCEGKECSVGAMYLRGELIYMDRRLKPHWNVYDAAVLLHELVHYVQEKSGGFGAHDCKTWLVQERQAYTLQAAWLRERRLHYPLEEQLPDESICETARAE